MNRQAQGQAQGVPVMIHRDTPEDMVATFQTLLAGLMGEAPGTLAVMPGQYHGQDVSIIALVSPQRSGQMGVAPIAVLMSAEDATGITMHGQDGGPSRKRQAHDGVPLSTGQYL